MSLGPQKLQDDSIVLGTGEGIDISYGRTERFSGELDFSDADALFLAMLSTTLIRRAT